MSRLINVEDYRRSVGRRLPKIIFDYLEGGALDERTLRANMEDLQWLRLRQSIMRDVSAVDLTSTVLGYTIRTPVMISPMGLLTLFCRDADVAMARAARAAGTIFVHSAWSGTPLRTVAAAAPGAVWAQLSLWKDAGLVRQHIERAEEAGIDVLVIAGDVSASSKRERDLRNGFGVAARPTIPSALNALRKPRWLANFTFGPKVTFGDQSINGQPMNLRQMERFMHECENDTATWRDIERVRERWPGKLAIKGVMSAADAQPARDAGTDAIFTSNHGGRQFDAQPSTTYALQEIAAAVGGETEILIDGGIRRGSDLLKLTALGARRASSAAPPSTARSPPASRESRRSCAPSPRRPRPRWRSPEPPALTISTRTWSLARPPGHSFSAKKIRARAAKRSACSIWTQCPACGMTCSRALGRLAAR
jgi:L-lactate dehydrogenase (cytochrome)